jgi:hypothetical protein
VLGVIAAVLVLLIGGCTVAVVVMANMAEETFDEFFIDFSDAERSTDPAHCEVNGLDFADDYVVDATITNNSGVTSAYSYSFDLTGPGGRLLGSDYSVAERIEPGDTVEDRAFNTVDGPVPPDDVICTITELLRVPVS